MAEITTATSVGWAVSPVVEMVISKIGNFIEKKYFVKSSLEEDMKKMNTSLLEILSTMVIVETHKIVDPNQVLLVRQIKDAVYDAEDCMDGFDYELAKEESEKLLPNKVRRVSASCSRAIHQVIVGNTSFKKKLNKVNKSLDQAKTLAKTLLEQTNANIPGNMQLVAQENQFITSSHISEEIFIGREKEHELIIEWILEEKAGPPTIIPIVGQGGLGKTTLAQMIFNDPSLNDHFGANKKIWLTVPDNFDKLKLTKDSKLLTELSSKKILMILDDVWSVKDNNKNYSYERGWLELLTPIRNANTGSTIIVTTREDVVVDTFKSLGSIRPIYLDALNDDDGWSLLKLKAFDGGNSDNIHDFEPIGRKIVNKLKGLPLAIRVVASRLRGKFNIEEWKRILKENSLDNDVMEVLHRSYEHLPAYLQRCFAYCSLFPKDYYLKCDRLVHMWIVHGFVFPKEGERLKDVGKSYFDELIARSFIQVIKRKNKEYYVVHDLMNDLACYVSKGECYILKEGETLNNLGSVRHLCVTTREHSHLKKIRDLDKLHTLVLLSSYTYRVHVCDEVFIKIKRIRVLDIDCRLDKLPNIGECKLLHYLCFRKHWLAPDTFSKLHLLTVLFIRKGGSSHLGIPQSHLALPQSICRMSRLQLIDTSKSINMDLGGQVQLHSVWRGGPAVFHVKKKKGWELGHLRHFNNINGGLEIYGLRHVASREEAIEAQLGIKWHVTELLLRWDDGESRVVESNIEHNEILEALRPHPNIKSLEIWKYPGDKFPSWLESNWLSRMTYISIEGGWSSGFTMLPALGQLSQLKKVRIVTVHTVSRIGDEFYGNGIFPSLEVLEIGHMNGLEEWSSPCGVHLFHKLCKLSIKSCQNLFSLPEMESFCSLKDIYILNCPNIMSLPKLPLSLHSLMLNGCRKLLSLPEMEFLCSLESIEIWDCQNIESLPKLPVSLHSLKLIGCQDLFILPKMESLCSLKSIQIQHCPILRSLPKIPVSLQDLSVAGAHFDLEVQLETKIGPEWDKVAAVSGCHCRTSGNLNWVFSTDEGE